MARAVLILGVFCALSSVEGCPVSLTDLLVGPNVGAKATQPMLGAQSEHKVPDEAFAAVLKEVEVEFADALLRFRQKRENIAALSAKDFEVCWYTTQVVNGIKYTATVSEGNKNYSFSFVKPTDKSSSYILEDSITELDDHGNPVGVTE